MGVHHGGKKVWQQERHGRIWKPSAYTFNSKQKAERVSCKQGQAHPSDILPLARIHCQTPCPHSNMNWGPKLWGTLLIQTMRPEFRSQHLCHLVTATCKPAPTYLASLGNPPPPHTPWQIRITNAQQANEQRQKPVSVCWRLVCGGGGGK